MRRHNTSITDARDILLKKKRANITDAREKLASLARQKDARLKLELLRKKRDVLNTTATYRKRNVSQNHNNSERRVPHRQRDRFFPDPSRQVVSQSPHNLKLQVRTENLQKNVMAQGRSFGNLPNESRFRRTIKNEFAVVNETTEEDSVVKLQTTSLDQPNQIQIRIVAHDNNVREVESVTTNRFIATKKDTATQPMPPSILKKRPMASLTTEKKIETPQKPTEYRIIVSNLANSVTGRDIQELFEDVGGMLQSRLVRPGIAEVLYRTVNDAQKAVDLYHNRQLDGQTMKCMLVAPRSREQSLPREKNPAPSTTGSSIEPDISTFHKILFSNFKS